MKPLGSKRLGCKSEGCSWFANATCLLSSSYLAPHDASDISWEETVARVVRNLHGGNYAFLRDLAESIFTQQAELLVHSLQVACLVDRLGNELFATPEEVRQASLAALLHDVGKILIPSEILNKPGPLTPEERQVMQEHAQRGSDFLQKVDDGSLLLSSQAALLHHERCDGQGYPFGLTLHEIPFFVRAIAICDAYSALRSPRIYKDPLPHDRAALLIRAENEISDGGKFDPDLLEFCLDRWGKWFARTHEYDRAYC